MRLSSAAGCSFGDSEREDEGLVGGPGRKDMEGDMDPPSPLSRRLCASARCLIALAVLSILSIVPSSVALPAIAAS